MAKVNQRLWRIPGHRARRKAWGYTAQVGGRQVKHYRADWTKDDADKALAALLLQVEQPREKASGLTLAQAAERYLATKARKRSLKEDRRILDHLKRALGADALLSNITASRISEYKTQRLAADSKCRSGVDGTPAKLSSAAVNRPLALLRHLLRLAHEEWEALTELPRIRLEKEPQGRLRWLTQDEIAKLLDACRQSRNDELHGAVVIAINTGLRLGELIGLTWDRVDLSRGVIRLEITKSGKRREVPMNKGSYRALVSLGPKDNGRVFRTRYIKTAYNSAVTTAKLDDVNFHRLRHTFASSAVMRGITLKELQELLGHSTLAMTMRYAHLAPEHLRTAVARLEGLTNERARESAQEPTELVGVSRNSST